jgi:hypothetical protein
VVVAGAAVAAVGEFRRRRQRSARRRREVVHAAGSAEADLAEAVDVVVAGPYGATIKAAPAGRPSEPPTGQCQQHPTMRRLVSLPR